MKKYNSSWTINWFALLLIGYYGKNWLVVLIVIGSILSCSIGDELLDMENDGIEDNEGFKRDGDG